MSSREIFARNLSALREAHDMSQEELAGRAEIDRTYVSALERGKYAVSVDVLDRIAAVFQVEACKLIDAEFRVPKK